MRAAAYVGEALNWISECPASIIPLPADICRAIPASAVEHEEPDAVRARILWADDNADMREYVRRLLAWRYDVVAVADGTAALATARATPPDLVLTDVMMPGLDGFGLLRELRADERTQTIPVILLSARAGEESSVEGLEAGADDYLIKPFSARELLARIHTHLEMAKLRRKWTLDLEAANRKLEAQKTEIYEALRQAYEKLRQTQQAVMEQERLRVLGQMASGIAHDINNALSPVALYTESLLEREPGLSAHTREYLEISQRAIDDVSHTLGRMREFYRQAEPQVRFVPVDLNKLAKQVLDLTRARWSDIAQRQGVVIQTHTDLAQDLPAICGVESEIREALTNLIFNAVDAMPEGGTLTLRTKAVGGASANGRSQRVHIEVEDTGCGMDSETLHRCLEPFFTTKGERGTGLGLAMVYGVAQRQGAEIEMESVVGNGTTVRLNFSVPASGGEAAPVPHTTITSQSLRILIVDDDSLIVRSLRNTLEADGHIVTTANGGREGIEALQAAVARKQPFAVVITDLGMPHVDGRKMARAVKMESPGTPVILLTGWGQRLVAQGDVPADVDRVLNKPPKLNQLRSALAELVPDSQANRIRMRL